MKFYYVYKALAHPEHHGYVRPFTFEERLMHVKEAKRTLGSEYTWICDTMQNELKHSLGDAPNSEFIIDPAGKVVRKRTWSNPEEVRRDLEELVGPVENPTTVEDLDLKTNPPPKVAAKGVVKKLELPRSLRPLKIEPVIKENGQPFYAKLRAEADNELTSNGKGKLYLAFHMDQLYHVHWNNLAKPIRVKLEPQSGIDLGETSLEGPKVEEPSDIDPREFLIDVNAGESREGSIRLSVSYFACNDEEGWCKPVSQEYVVHLEVDPDGGWAQGRRPGGRNDKGRRKGAPANRKRPAPDNAERGMGRIVKIELEGRLLTVRIRGGDEVQYKVDAEARLMRERKPARLADFKTGEFVMLRIKRVKQGPQVITGMMQRPPPRGAKGKRR